MSEATIGLIGSIIVAMLSLFGVVYSVNKSTSKMQQQLQSDIQAHLQVTDVRIEELTREVREHNDFARRIPLSEGKIEALEERMDTLEDNLSKLHKEHRERCAKCGN